MCQTLLSKRPLLTGFCYVVSVMNKLCLSICTTLPKCTTPTHLTVLERVHGFTYRTFTFLFCWNLVITRVCVQLCMNGFLSILIEKRFCTTHFFQWLCMYHNCQVCQSFKFFWQVLCLLFVHIVLTSSCLMLSSPKLLIEYPEHMKGP